MRRHKKKGLLLLCMLSTVSSAQSLPDPTRPPAEISNTSPVTDGKTISSVNSGLQSIIIAPNHRAAIINGKTVLLGEKYGNAKLVEVTERGVVLLGKQGKQVMSLFPGVKLKMKGGATPAQSGSALPHTANKKINESDNKAVNPAAPEEEK